MITKLVVGFLLLLLGTVVQIAVAQSSTNQWTEPQAVWGYEDEAEPPFLVADQARTVHALNSRQIDLGIDITYRRWTLDHGWTVPVDVILSPEKDIARLRGVVLDDEGYLHLVFYGGDELGASIYYTYAPDALADRATAWATPQLIGDQAGPVSDAAFVGDGKGALFVVYTGSAEGMGTYVTYSLDGGLTWSETTQIHQATEFIFPTHYSLALDDAGRLHIVWAEANLAGNGETLYYVRSDENQLTWTEPFVLAQLQEGGYEVDWPSLVYHQDELLLVYQDSSPARKWMRRSLDSGASWFEPEALFAGFIGEYGHVSFAKDSTDNLHMLLGNRTGSPAVHGLWHALWQNGHWSDLQPVVSGFRVVSLPGEDGFDPNRPRAVISQGNLLLVTWQTDPGAGLNGIFYSSAQLNTPELPVISFDEIAPTPILQPASAEASPELSVPTPQPTPIFSGSHTPPAVNSSPLSSLLFGLIAVLAFVGSVSLIRFTRRGCRN